MAERKPKDEQPEWAADVLKRIKKTGGALSKMTPARAVAIVGALRQGVSRDAAAGVAGVNYNTLWRWMLADPEMTAVVEEAEAISEHMYVGVIESSAKTGTWQAAAWMLERKWPKKYGRRDRTDITIETRQLAHSIAEAHGLDEAELIARAESIVAEAREAQRKADG